VKQRQGGGDVSRDRLRALVREHRLPSPADAQLAALLAALGEEDAPTAVQEPTAAADVHLADSLTALEIPEVRAATAIADLGAGAGLPGLPLAIALPTASVALVESVSRKCAFLRDVVGRLGLRNVDVVCDRAEGWRDGFGRCDVVTARALAGLPVLCEYAAPLLREGGLLVAWKARVDDDEAAGGRAAAEQLGLVPEAVRVVVPYAGSQHRTLHLFRKVAPTPPGFPRRPGMAAKRPLGVRPRR